MRRFRTLEILACLLVVIAAGCQSSSTQTADNEIIQTPPQPVLTATTTATPTSTPFPTQPVPPEGTVTIEYIGNSSIIITAWDGTRILCDPYSTHAGGLTNFPTSLTADVVTISHAHPDHGNASAVGGDPEVVRRAGVYQFGIVSITGFAGFEGSPTGPAGLPHVIFVFQIGDIKIVHMGDAGVPTEPEILAAIQDADVMITNIDGYVMRLHFLWPFLDDVNARTYMPTHYSMNETARWQGAPTLEEFISYAPEDWPVETFNGILQVTAGMPRQIVAVTAIAIKE